MYFTFLSSHYIAKIIWKVGLLLECLLCHEKSPMKFDMNKLKVGVKSAMFKFSAYRHLSSLSFPQTLLSFKLTSPSVISASDLSPLIAGSSASVLARHLVTASICFITRCIVRSVVSSLFCSSVRCFLPAEQQRPEVKLYPNVGVVFYPVIIWVFTECFFPLSQEKHQVTTQV